MVKCPCCGKEAYVYFKSHDILRYFIKEADISDEKVSVHDIMRGRRIGDYFYIPLKQAPSVEESMQEDDD